MFNPVKLNNYYVNLLKINICILNLFIYLLILIFIRFLNYFRKNYYNEILINYNYIELNITMIKI